MYIILTFFKLIYLMILYVILFALISYFWLLYIWHIFVLLHLYYYIRQLVVICSAVNMFF